MSALLRFLATTRGRLALVLLPVVLIYGALLVKSRGGVRLEKGIQLDALRMPDSAPVGGTLPVELTFSTPQGLDPETWVFLHIEATGEGAERNCRMIYDRPAPAGLLAGTWTAGPVVHKVEVPVPTSCRPTKFRVFSGLWNRGTGARYEVVDPKSVDNRLQIATVAIEPTGTAMPEPVTTSSSGLKRRILSQILEPWYGWAAGLLAAAIAAVFLSRRVDEKPDDETSPLPVEVRWGAFAVPSLVLVLGILVVLEFVKDDAYISFRYAHNFVKGHGLTFNPGERLEGYTNFLWTLLLVPFEALGWDLFQVCEVLGTLISIGVIVLMTFHTIRLDRERKELTQLWAAMWLATSSSWVLWAKSGLEQCLAGLLPLAAAWFLFKAREEEDDGRAVKLGAYAGLLAALAAMTRPELHMIGAILGLPLVWDAIKARKLPKRGVVYALVLIGLTGAFHFFRYRYYHALLPNTFYAKTGKSDLIWREGLNQLHEMFLFNDLGYVVVLVPFAFMTKKRMIEKLVALTIAVAFMVFLVKVGVDEMQWFRLYLPALPFLLILAGLGLRNLLDAVGVLIKREGLVPAAIGWALVAFAGWNSFQFTFKELNGFNGHADLAGTYHPDLGKFITRHERAGGLVAFQDMGSTPYHAPDVDFLDFIGLTDGTVARARHAYGLHAFIASDEGGNRFKYNAEMREYFWRRNPEWAILTVYPPRDQEQAIAERFGRDPTPASIGNAYANNSFQFGIWEDPRFHAGYVHVRTWQRSRGYYLSLFRRKDLWDQTPGEVVFDQPPPGVTGVKATFDEGLELLGGTLDPQNPIQRHEFFVTTWWKLPGPLGKDVLFFLHVAKEGYQAPMDHVPGDSMYPADRWQKGQILEDRVLFQLPINMKPGTYSVYIGAYRKNGDRFKVLTGPNDGQHRVLVGTIEVRPLRPFFHQLIPPTVPEKMRKYPERILDGRKH